jgi:apolipoprotein N-acyltransferase
MMTIVLLVGTEWLHSWRWTGMMWTLIVASDFLKVVADGERSGVEISSTWMTIPRRQREI